MLVSKIPHVVLALFAMMLGVDSVSAETANVSIPQGTSTPGCETTNSCYLPAEISISVNDEVTWTNVDTASHTVTSGNPSDGPDGNFDSSLFASGNSFSHTFESAGTFPYFCQVHPWMVGEIVVSSSGPDISFSNLRAVNSFGNPVANIKAGQQIQFTADITNNNDLQQPFAYVIEVINQSPAWITGSLAPNQSFSPALSRIFDSPGTYQVIAHLYDKMENPQSLAAQLSIMVSVDANTQRSQTITVNADKSKYYGGDTIVISGSVFPADDSQPVIIQVFSESNNLITVSETEVMTGGQYVAEIIPGGDLWDDNSGDFTVKATYKQSSDQTEIEYIGSPETVIVTLSTDPIKPVTGSMTDLKINFKNPQTNQIQEHIDYKITITKDGDIVYGPTALTHSTEGTVTLPIEFQEQGKYEITVDVQGILFEPTPSEKTKFSLMVGQSDQTAVSTSDPDDDGITAGDLCPDSAEDFDGYADSDGCPEENPTIPEETTQGPEVYVAVIIVIIIIPILLIIMRKRKKGDDSEAATLPGKPTRPPEDKSQDYSLEDSKLK